MAVEASREQEHTARTQAYAEALAYFIAEPKAINDPTLRLFVDFFKERIALEEERLAKGLGTQAQLAKV